ncbi:MAG TPA: metalloregulator ArsR/SmtB family transcription factor [Anaerolineae bacterium]
MKKAPSLYAVQANLFAAIAHPMRLQILELLRNGEVCVCHIQATLRRRQAYVSQHLMALRQAGLVATRKEGLRVYYRMSDPQLLNLLDRAREMICAPDMVRSANVTLTPPRGQCNCPQCVAELEASNAEVHHA